MAERMDEGTEAEAEIDAPKLTVRQERFSQKFVECGVAAEAYRFAYGAEGYSPDALYVTASRLLNSPKIKLRVETLKAEVLAAAQVTSARIIGEYAKLGFASMDDYITVQDDGTAYVDLSRTTKDQRTALGEMTIDEFTEGRGETARDVRRVKIKLGDKKGALDSLARIAGLFIDKHEVTGKDGAPLAPDVSTRDLARSVLDILRTARLADQPAPEDDASDNEHLRDSENGELALRGSPAGTADVQGRSEAVPATPSLRFNPETGELE